MSVIYQVIIFQRFNLTSIATDFVNNAYKSIFTPQNVPKDFSSKPSDISVILSASSGKINYSNI